MSTQGLLHQLAQSKAQRGTENRGVHVGDTASDNVSTTALEGPAVDIVDTVRSAGDKDGSRASGVCSLVTLRERRWPATLCDIDATATTQNPHERCRGGRAVYSVVEPRGWWAPLRSPGLLGR